MAVIPIYNAYHPILREKSQDVENYDDSTVKLIDDMWDTLYNISNGIGLAGNQVGSNKSVLIINMGVGNPDEESNPITMVNPVITDFSDDEDEMEEGCLSIPEFYEKVKRPAGIQVNYYDREMKEHKKEVTGFLARVMQHEIDHLNGILFFDRLTPLRKTLSKNKLRKIEQGKIKTGYPMVQADGKLTE